MGNDFLIAITTQLGQYFGDGYHYYVEDVEQGLMKPCFTVDMLEPVIRSRSATDYDRKVPIVIHYYTDDLVNVKAENYKMAERLIDCLEYLNFEDCLIRGENISWHIVDDVLQMFMTYRFRTTKQNVVDNMDNIITPEVSTTGLN